MKNILYKTALLFLALMNIYMLAAAQKSDFTLGLIMPETSADFNQVQIQKLESKITQIINASNEVLVGYTNDFVVYPVITVQETAVVEGGMQNITVTDIDFSLFVKQLSGESVVYNAVSRKLKGSGNNKEQSITNAISQIKINDVAYQQFLSVAKNKIVKYYSDNCAAIIQRAGSLSAGHDYEQALSVLQSIPVVSGSCYTTAQQKSVEVYKKYQTELCSKNVTKAKAAIAINDYTTAMAAMELIDPSSSCYPEVKKMIDQIASKVEKKEQREYDLETQRMNAMKEIAKAYYSRTVHVSNYNVLIRR